MVLVHFIKAHLKRLKLQAKTKEEEDRIKDNHFPKHARTGKHYMLDASLFETKPLHDYIGLKFGRCELCAACCLLVNHPLHFEPSLEGFLVTFGGVWVPKRVPNRSPNRLRASKMHPLVPRRPGKNPKTIKTEKQGAMSTKNSSFLTPGGPQNPLNNHHKKNKKTLEIPVPNAHGLFCKSINFR